MNKSVTLTTTTQGVKGNAEVTREQGSATIKVYNEIRSLKGAIYVDVFVGSGSNYKRREDELINIEFSDGKTWSGSFDEIKNILMPINQLLEQPKKNGFIILMDLGSSFQPTFHEDEGLMFFSTAEAAQEEINSHIGDSEKEAEVGGIDEAYSLEDYQVHAATLDVANDIITCEVDGVSYSMYRSDDDYVATELFFNAINQD